MIIDSQTSLTCNGKVYLFGGFIGGAKPHYSNKTFLFEPESVTYKQIESSGLPPLARSDHSSALINDEMVIFGGISDNNTYLNDVWMLNLSQYSWRRIGVAGEKPSERIGHSCASYSNVLIIFGGHEEASKENTRIYALDVSKPVWRKFADTNYERENEEYEMQEAQEIKKSLLNSGMQGGLSPKKSSSPSRGFSPIKEVASSSKSHKSKDVLHSRDLGEGEGKKEKTITAKELKLERIKKKKEVEKRRLLDEFDVGNVTEREIVDKEITKMQNILEAINSEKDTTQLVKGRMRVMRPGISRFSEKIGSRLEPIALPHLDGLSMCRDTSRIFIFGGDKWGLCSNDLFVVDLEDLLSGKTG